MSGVTALEIHDVPDLPARAADSHKGTYGRVLVVAGSWGMSGAAILCGSATLRGGAGLARVALPQSILPIVAAGNPCYTTIPLPQDDAGQLHESSAEQLLRLEQDNDVVALGPGLGQSPGLSALVRRVVSEGRRPLVLDADGLNALRGECAILKNRPAPLILTPHPGELGRLLGLSTAAVQAQRRELAVRFAAEQGVIVVLKGHGTLVTDGQRVFINPTGNPGMATGGAGDVLTGLIAALLGQRLDPFAAARLGVFVHGRAGDLACDAVGEVALTASDLLDHLPAAWKERTIK